MQVNKLGDIIEFMPKRLNKRHMRTQLAIIYTVMVMAVLLLVSVLVFIIQGYRYNSADGKVEQGGLVQFNSKPSGAAVTVDDMILSSKTASKLVLSSGSHTVTMSKSGYNTWKKDIVVKPGSVLWLNYALLYPQNPVVSTAVKYSSVAQSLVADDKKTIAVITDATKPEIDLPDIGSDTVNNIKLVLPIDIYTVANEPESQNFSLVMWSKDDNLLLIKHSYDNTQEYISVNIRDVTKSINVTHSLGINIAKISYALNDNNILYVLNTNHELRRANLNNLTITGPLASAVDDFSVPEANTITFTTLPDEIGKRTVGYLSSDSNKSKTISSYTGLADATLKITSGQYYGEHYIAILHGTNLDILSGNLLNSSSNDVLAIKPFKTVVLKNSADYLSFSPGSNRFVVTSKGTKITIYDLELKNISVATLQSPINGDLNWLDNYHFATTNSGSGYYYDFDGTNGQLFASDVMALPTTFDNNSKYIYYFTKTQSAVLLNRTRLTN